VKLERYHALVIDSAFFGVVGSCHAAILTSARPPVKQCIRLAK
jgi:hypothetical protein